MENTRNIVKLLSLTPAGSSATTLHDLYNLRNLVEKNQICYIIWFAFIVNITPLVHIFFPPLLQRTEYETKNYTISL